MKRLIAIILCCTLLSGSFALSESEGEKLLGIDMNAMSVEELQQCLEQLRYYQDLFDDLVAKAEQLITEQQGKDYSSMSAEEAANAIGKSIKNFHWKFDSCEMDPEVVFVDVRQDGIYWDESSLLISAIQFSIDYIKEAFTCDGIPQLYFRFHENGRDKNGHQVDMTTITMRVTKEKAAALDLDYFHEYSYTQQLAFLKAINGYSLHASYKAIAQ